MRFKSAFAKLHSIYTMNEELIKRMYHESGKMSEQMNDEAWRYQSQIMLKCDVWECRKDLLKRARCVVEKFIKDKLSDDINNLLRYNFADLYNDHTYGYCYGNPFSPEDCEIVRAIETLVFEDVWPKNQGCTDTYKVFLITPHKQLVNSMIVEGLPQKLQSKFNECHTRYYYNIGNMVLLPSALSILMEDSTEKWCINNLIEFIYIYLNDYKQLPIKVYKQFCKCKESFGDYHDARGFERLLDSLMLTDFIDESLRPKNDFLRFEVNDNNVSSKTYFETVDRFLNSYEHYITTRVKWIIYKLQDKLGRLIY